MADENVRNLRDGTITLKDAGANTLELVVDTGDLSWVETSNITDIKDRQRLSHMRLGEEESVTLSFSLKYKYSVANGSEPLSPYEVFHFQDGAAAWASTNDCGDVKTLDIKFVMVDPCSTGEDETVLFRKVPLPGITFEEGDEFNTMSFEGKAFITKPSIYRGTTTTTTTV